MRMKKHLGKKGQRGQQIFITPPKAVLLDGRRFIPFLCSAFDSD